jgi:hypothetical protein
MKPNSTTERGVDDLIDDFDEKVKVHEDDDDFEKGHDDEQQQQQQYVL